MIKRMLPLTVVTKESFHCTGIVNKTRLFLVLAAEGYVVYSKVSTYYFRQSTGALKTITGWHGFRKHTLSSGVSVEADHLHTMSIHNRLSK